MAVLRRWRLDVANANAHGADAIAGGVAIDKLMSRLPKSAPPRHLNIHVPLPRNVFLFYAPSFSLLYYSPILAVNLT
jgi:hypothetical protein